MRSLAKVENTFVQKPSGFVAVQDRALRGLCHAVFEAFVDGLLVGQQPVFFGFQEAERVGDDFVRID